MMASKGNKRTQKKKKKQKNINNKKNNSNKVIVKNENLKEKEYDEIKKIIHEENNNENNNEKNIEKEIEVKENYEETEKLKDNKPSENEFKIEKNKQENKVVAEEPKKEGLDDKINKSKNKNNYFISIIVAFLIIVILFFSIIFALLNMNNLNIAKGVKIKNIEISNLSKQDAKEKVKKTIETELKQSLNIKLDDKYETILESSQIEFSYKDIEKTVEKAYEIGRTGNIIIDNYMLLYTSFFEKNIDLEYTYNEKVLEDFIENAESNIPGVVIEPSYYIEENELIINKGTDGIIIDRLALKKEILNSIKNGNTIKEIEIPVLFKEADKINMNKIYEEIYTEPKDAYYELEPFNIYPEVNGVDLEIDIEEAKNQINNEEKDEYRFNLIITPPEITIKSFGFEAFPKQVSSFSTKYDAKNINRSKNLEIAAEKINGIVLMPNEIFSFNKTVGKRTVEEGYREAKIYQDGAVVDGLAGGICQISSTLYNAVLLANLEIVERRNHTFTTSYLSAGRDATVVYGTTDFQFKNSRSYPIKIEATVSDGTATFNIYSVSFEEIEYEVKIKPVYTQSIPYAVEYVPDATLLPGQQIVQQKGQPGYRVTTYRELLQGGVIVSSEELSKDVYKPMKNIIKIGP